MQISPGRHSRAIGRDHRLDEGQELVGARARRHREVDGVALAVAVAEIRRGPRARIERALVDARVEDPGGAVEDRLGAVAMVDVPVDHQDALDAALLESVRGGHRDVVEQAEAHRSVSLGVVSRRPQATEGEPPVGEYPLCGVHRPAGRVKRGLPGAGAGHRVEVDQPAPAPRELLNRVDVALVVDPLEAARARRPAPRRARGPASLARPWPPRSQLDAGRSPGGRRCRARTNSDDGHRVPSTAAQ